MKWTCWEEAFDTRGGEMTSAPRLPVSVQPVNELVLLFGKNLQSEFACLLLDLGPELDAERGEQCPFVIRTDVFQFALHHLPQDSQIAPA